MSIITRMDASIGSIRNSSVANTWQCIRGIAESNGAGDAQLPIQQGESVKRSTHPVKGIGDAKRLHSIIVEGYRRTLCS